MLNAADRIRSLGRQSDDTGQPSSIFGSATGLAQSIETDDQFRVAVYPIICAEMPEVAMGLASCLCYLLEQYPSTSVYRCFAKIASTDESGEITADDYQFHAADWELEGLADNVIVYGSLSANSGQLTLQLTIDTGLQALDDGVHIDFEFGSLQDAVNGLPSIAARLYSQLAGESHEQAIVGYASVSRDASGLPELLESVFDWNLDVYLYLWDVNWDEDDVRAQFLELAKHSNESRGEFAHWCLGMITQQVMQVGLDYIGEMVVPLLDGAILPDADFAPAAAGIAQGLACLDYNDRAVELLESYLSADVHAAIWNRMIDIHLSTAHVGEAIDKNQLALESGLLHPALYWRYAQLLMSAEANELEIEELLLIDPDEYDEEDHISLEISEALKRHLEASPANLSALQLALAYMIDVEDPELWDYFERMVQSDHAGAYIGEIIERLPDVVDHRQAYSILQRFVDTNPYAYVYAAQLAVLDGDHKLAEETIDACRRGQEEVDDDLELELQQLSVYAKLPGFEKTFAELKVMLNAQRPVTEADVELLEQAVDIAPLMIDVYLILSRCYLRWKDIDAAFEVLEDAAKAAGSHPQIELGLAQILWIRNQRDEAIEKLNRALEKYPADVYLLVQMANYLIANDQLDDARAYIARAESIAPSHQAIWQVRKLVAQKMAE